jgi:hypothetical protein
MVSPTIQLMHLLFHRLPSRNDFREYAGAVIPFRVQLPEFDYNRSLPLLDAQVGMEEHTQPDSPATRQSHLKLAGMIRVTAPQPSVLRGRAQLRSQPVENRTSGHYDLDDGLVVGSVFSDTEAPLPIYESGNVRNVCVGQHLHRVRRGILLPLVLLPLITLPPILGFCFRHHAQGFLRYETIPNCLQPENLHPRCLHLFACMDGDPIPEFSGVIGGVRTI